MERQVDIWEGEGGAGKAPIERTMSGTVNQVEWPERIKRDVNLEFDRVSSALVSATSRQSMENRTDAQSVIAILEDKRAEVMANKEAGYFIHEWQEMNGRVRQLIVQDPRDTAIKANRAARRG